MKWLKLFPKRRPYSIILAPMGRKIMWKYKNLTGLEALALGSSDSVIIFIIQSNCFNLHFIKIDNHSVT